MAARKRRERHGTRCPTENAALGHVEVNAADDRGVTPLNTAAQVPQSEAIDILVHAGERAGK